MYDIIIVGAGPAGLSAAIYARRANKTVLVLEGNAYGGQIINSLSIDNYPAEPHISGFDFATKIYNQAKDLGAEIKFEKVLEVNERKEVTTAKNVYKAKAVILATGAYPRKLNIDGEEKWIGKGISYCATCDGAFYKNKIVAVVGGGNTALEDAIYLSHLANKVYLIHRREEFRGEENYVKELKSQENVEMIYNSHITKLDGKDKMNKIILENRDGIETELEIDGLFIAIGRVPETQAFSSMINVDKNGYVISLENCHTNIEGIFVAGDNRTKELRQLVTATSDGAISATQAIKYINQKDE